MKSKEPLLDPLPPMGAVEATNRVLEAEQTTRQAMADCDRQAEALLREGRERARRIAQRAEQRIQQWHLANDRRAAERLAELEQRAQAILDEPLDTPELPAEWQAVLEQLANELLAPTGRTGQ